MINGTIVPAGKAVLLTNDLSVQRGYGIFDFFKTLHGRPVFLDDHLERFYNSAEQMRLPVGYNSNDLKSLIAELMQKNNLPFSGVRITLTGGYSEDGYTVSSPNMILTQQPLHLPGGLNKSAIKLVTYAHQRQMPHVKTIDYIMAIWLQPYIAKHLADDVLYHSNNIITECPRPNIFIVAKNGTIATPANKLLRGIIRKQLLQHFKKQFSIQERDVSIGEIYESREAFVTSSTKDILPIVEVDGRPIGDGKPGEITLRLNGKLQEIINSSTGVVT